MLVLVGLGNPETKHSLNRHNVGFMTIDRIVHKYCSESYKNKFQSQIIEKKIAGNHILLVKPQTYMNLSGQSVSNIMNFYKLKSEDIIVIHDDLDLDIGNIKTKTGGGSGGHNGLKSIDLNIAKDYRRIRIGIGHPGDKNLVSHYVLGNFNKQESNIIDKLIDDIALNLDLIINNKENNLTQLFSDMCIKKE